MKAAVLDPASQPPCMRFSKHLSVAVSLLLLTGIGAVQLLDNPFATNLTGMVHQHVTSLWYRGSALLLEDQHEEQLLTGAESATSAAEEAPQTAPAPPHSIEDVLAQHPQLAETCTDAYRDVQYDKVAKWGIPPLMQTSCDYPRCEDWTIHEMLDHYRKRGQLGPLKTMPCDVWRALFGRTTWLMGDSQTQYWYRTLRCVLRDFQSDPNVKDEPLTTDPDMVNMLKERVFLHYEAGVGMPICTRFVGNTRVCLIRVNMGYHMADQYFTQLHLLNASKSDLLFINTGLWHHKRDGQYQDIIANITRVVSQHRDALPLVIWRDNSPQHFDIEHGEFPHPEEVGEKLTFPIQCKAFEGLSLDAHGALQGNHEHVRAGGWRNKLSQPLVDAAGIAHLHTWNETALWWRMHTRQENGNIECTHFCGPGPYHLWVWLQTELLRSMELPPLEFVPVVQW